MKYGFSVFQQEANDHVFWIAKSNVLKGCVGQGDSCDAAIAELAENEIEWLQTAEALSIPVPNEPVIPERQYSGKFALRMSSFMHKQLDMISKAEGISVNHLICDAIAMHLHDLTAAPIISEKKVSNVPSYTTDNIVQFTPRLMEN